MALKGDAVRSSVDSQPRATGGLFKLCESDHGTLSLVGILPDGRPSTSSGAGSGLVGSSSTYTHASISDDESKVFFMASVGGFDNVYMRSDNITAVQINVSECSASGRSQRPVAGCLSGR